MSKDVLSEAQLLNWLNSELASHANCEECRFTSVLRLREPDIDGCNWSALNFRCSGKSVNTCEKLANEIVAIARNRIELAAGDA
jgi:hypothetical protein